jgi:hypothetical protein
MNIPFWICQYCEAGAFASALDLLDAASAQAGAVTLRAGLQQHVTSLSPRRRPRPLTVS